MSASLSKKVVGISRVANFLELKDVSDLKELSGQDPVHNDNNYQKFLINVKLIFRYSFD